MKAKYLIAILFTIGVMFIFWALQMKDIGPTPEVTKSHQVISKTQKNSYSLDQDQISQIIEKSRSSLNRCYALLLQNEPQAKGDVLINMIIDNQGKVKEPKITLNFTSDTNFQSCLLGVLKRMDFPPHSGELISTSFPLKFE